MRDRFLKLLRNNFLVILGLLVLAVRYYPMAGRFLDLDEQIFFHVTALMAQGQALYLDLPFSYPPFLFLLSFLVFKLIPNLYWSMLIVRLGMITVSLAGFSLIFRLFQKKGLALLIVPMTIFFYFNSLFYAKLIEFRPDNLLYFLMVLQGYLIAESFDKKLSVKTFAAMLGLVILALHTSQKAIYIEPPLIALFLFYHFKEWRGWLYQRRKGLAVSAAGFFAVLLFSKSYQQMIFQSYLTPLLLLLDKSAVFRSYTTEYALGFLALCLLNDLGFWLMGAGSFIVLAVTSFKKKIHLMPVLLIVFASLLIWSFYPYMQYQLYTAWAVILSLPFFFSYLSASVLKNKLILPLLVLGLSLTSLYTFMPSNFDFKPLAGHAAESERIRSIAESGGVAAIWGAVVNHESDIPLRLAWNASAENELLWKKTDIAAILKENNTKFIHPDQRRCIPDLLSDKDKKFMTANYQKCAGLRLRIAAKWLLLRPGVQTVELPLGGRFRLFLLPDRGNYVSLDLKKINGGQVVELAPGRHQVYASRPAVLLVEHDSDKIASEGYAYLSRQGQTSFIPLKADFSGKFRLLGVLKHRTRAGVYFRFFWRVLSRVDDDLISFHHFVDGKGRYLFGANIQAADGWLSTRQLTAGELVSYDFFVPASVAYQDLRVGWFYKQNWSKRLVCNGFTYFVVPRK